MDKFGEDAYTLSDDRDNAEEETTSTLEYINKLLKDNEIITDRSQLKLFTKDQLGPIQPDGLPPLNDTTQNSCG